MITNRLIAIGSGRLIEECRTQLVHKLIPQDWKSQAEVCIDFFRVLGTLLAPICFNMFSFW